MKEIVTACKKIALPNKDIVKIELSKKIGLSAAPTLGRVLKLEKHGIISNYHAILDYSKLGLGFTALVQVSLSRQKSSFVNNFLNQINEIDEIVECLQLTGNFDYQLRIIVKDIPSFDAIIAEKLGMIEEIGQMQTTVVLSTQKSSIVAPIDYSQEIKIK